MPSLGEELKQAREERGIKLREIADATHIGLRFLQAIEADDYSILPGGIFNRSFVRSYARYVGLDEEYVLTRYNQQVEAQERESGRNLHSPFEVSEGEGTSSWGRTFIILLILVILGAGGYGAYLYYQVYLAKATKSGQSQPLRSEAQRPEPVTPPGPEPKASPEPAISSLASVPATSTLADELKLQILARDGDCWLRVKVDQDKTEERTLKQGETGEYMATERIVLTLGNVPAVTLTLNGAPVKLQPTSKGSVAENVLITKESYQSFIQ